MAAPIPSTSTEEPSTDDLMSPPLSPTVSELAATGPVLSEPEQYEKAMNILLHTRNEHIPKVLDRLCEALPQVKEQLRGSVDLPLIVVEDSKKSQTFLCQPSIDNAYRSPWSGHYFRSDGSTVDGLEARPPTHLETSLNEAFQVYCSMYYGHDGQCCVTLGEEGSSAEGGPVTLVKVLIKKELSPGNTWDSIHAIEIQDNTARMTSTLMLETANTSESRFSVQMINQVRTIPRLCVYLFSLCIVGAKDPVHE